MMRIYFAEEIRLNLRLNLAYSFQTTYMDCLDSNGTYFYQQGQKVLWEPIYNGKRLKNNLRMLSINMEKIGSLIKVMGLFMVLKLTSQFMMLQDGPNNVEPFNLISNYLSGLICNIQQQIRMITLLQQIIANQAMKFILQMSSAPTNLSGKK